MALTPGVKTQARFGIEQRTVTTRPFHYRRDAKHIGRGILPGAGEITGAQRTAGGDAWILREKYSELAQLMLSENEADVIRAGDVNLPPGIEPRDSFRKGSDLPGLGTAAEVVATGINSFRKRVGEIADWAQQALLGSDIPQPDIDGEESAQTVPLDRIIEGKTSYPENCPFLLWLRLPPATDVGQDALCSFYFGGAASVLPQEAEGGRFCLTLRGNGEAMLREWETPEGAENPWVRRYRCSLASEQRGTEIFVKITPYGKDRLWVRKFSTVNAGPGDFGGGPLTTAANAYLRLDEYTRRGVPQGLYLDKKSRGHEHESTLTGPGPIMLDHRREPRADVTIVRGKYVNTSVIPDGPFSIPRGTPANTPIDLELDTYTIPNSLVSGAIHDATTHEALSTDDDGNFLSNAGQRNYYVRIVLTSADGVQTPVLWGYNVDIQPVFGEAVGDPLSAPAWGTQVTGPDVEPDHDTANLLIKDRRGAYSLLRVQDRLRSTVSLVDSVSGAVITHLFEGETLQVHARKRGNASHLPNWYDYDVRFVGLWAKIKRQFYGNGRLTATQDPNAPIKPGTLEKENIPWKVTDWLREVLKEAGVPEDEIDIPDSPLRFWMVDPSNKEDTTLQYGTDLAALAAKLAKDYLSAVFLRDPNAGTRGMWRTLVNPQPPYTNSLATLYHERPSAAGHPAIRANAFGPGTALIEDGSWDTWPVAPEVTHITVYGLGEHPGGGPGRLEREVFTKGWDDPSSPNYTGEIIPFSHGPDPGLQTQEAVDWQARTLQRLAGNAQKWWKARTALLLVTDPLDTLQTRVRPLRVNDQVTIITAAGTFKALVRSCDPTKVGSDGHWHQDLTGIFVA